MSERALATSGAAADLLSLTKPRLSALVLATAAGGMWLSPGHLSVVRSLLTLIATAGIIGRQTDYDAAVARPLLGACVAICKSCGDECERHAHMPHCRVCAEACRRCEQACRDLLDATK